MPISNIETRCRPTGVLEIPESKISVEDKLPTYIEGVDKVLNGGFIKGTSILISGLLVQVKQFYYCTWRLTGFCGDIEYTLYLLRSPTSK